MRISNLCSLKFSLVTLHLSSSALLLSSKSHFPPSRILGDYKADYRATEYMAGCGGEPPPVIGAAAQARSTANTASNAMARGAAPTNSTSLVGLHKHSGGNGEDVGPSLSASGVAASTGLRQLPPQTASTQFSKSSVRLGRAF